MSGQRTLGIQVFITAKILDANLRWHDQTTIIGYKDFLISYW
jgi:hypothetical protein